MKNRLIIFALGLSRPGTMGGNSKITIEMARCLASQREVHFVLPEEKLPTSSRHHKSIYDNAYPLPPKANLTKRGDKFPINTVPSQSLLVLPARDLRDVYTPRYRLAQFLHFCKIVLKSASALCYNTRVRRKPYRKFPYPNNKIKQ